MRRRACTLVRACPGGKCRSTMVPYPSWCQHHHAPVVRMRELPRHACMHHRAYVRPHRVAWLWQPARPALHCTALRGAACAQNMCTAGRRDDVRAQLCGIAPGLRGLVEGRQKGDAWCKHPRHSGISSSSQFSHRSWTRLPQAVFFSHTAWTSTTPSGGG